MKFDRYRLHEQQPVDHLKPPLPYTTGALLRIEKHIPPPPFGSGYLPPQRHNSIRDFQTRYGTPSRACLENPPPETGAPTYPAIRSMTIVDQIACFDGRGSQLVTCHIEKDGRKSSLLVAKIYDPLYYNWNGEDITYLADLDYSREASAFMLLRAFADADELGYRGAREALSGSIPRFHGCWTWRTHLLDGQSRDVRLILMDYIPYPSMLSILDRGKVDEIPAESRMELLAKALEIYCWLEFVGVWQNDIAPRNIMVDSESNRVVLLDFSNCIIRDLPNTRNFVTIGTPPSFPKSPIEIFRASFGVIWGDWIPVELESKKAQYAWFMEKWGKSTTFEPPEPELLDRIELYLEPSRAT